jgi:hypothetical protein
MNIMKKFLLQDNFHLNEKYPIGFDMETLKDFELYGDRLDYVREKLKFLGEGSSRAVFAIDDKRVIKVAVNKKGIGQNEAELRFGKKQHALSSNTYQFTGKGYNICSRNYDWDDSYRFLEVERAQSFPESGEEEEQIFCYITGFECFDDLYYAINNIAEWGIEDIHKMHVAEDKLYIKKLPWFQELITFVTTNEFIVPGDFYRLSTYGMVIREGKPQIIIVDYGFTPSVADNYY